MKSKSSKLPRSQSVAFASCSFAIDTNGQVQLLPAGNFRSRDGRPTECAHWVTNATIAAQLIADIATLANPIVIDYEHQTLLSADNGQPAPAAGWWAAAGMEWRDGEGLFAKVEWTERAKLHIEAGEYKYLSPVIAYDKKTGAIKKIFNAALTNNAAIDGMEEVTARLTAALINQEKLTMDMDDLLENLRWMLNLPTLATPEEIMAELQKAVAAIKSAAPEATAAAGFRIDGLLTSLGTQVASLKAAVPDPARFVPIDVMTELQTEVSALRNEKIEREVGEVVAAALSAGKLLPPQEKWARDLGKSNLAVLKEYLETAQPIAALKGMQTNDKPANELSAGELSEDEVKLCAQMGVSIEAYKKTKAEEAALSA